MNKKRCAFVAAAVLVVCTVAYLCWIRFGNEAEEVVAATESAPSAKAAEAVSLAVASGTGAVLQFPSNQTATVRGTKPFVLTSEKPFQKSLRLAAESLGARTVCSLSRTSLMVEADPAARVRLSADGRFSSVDEFLPSDKIDPDLAKLIADGAERVEVVIVTLSENDRLDMLKRVVDMGGEILTGCLNDGDNFRASLSAERIADLAGRGDVRWLEPFVRPRATNDHAVEPAGMFVREAWDVHGLSGTNQFVSTSDTGVDLEHLDLKDQVVGHDVATSECNTKDLNGHGTHTAGSIAGAGVQSMDYEGGPIRGSAWGAKLWVWFCDGGTKGILTPDSLGKLFQPSQTNMPAYIHSASWGSSQMGKYEERCNSIDAYVWKNPEFLPVYSAGNDGEYGETTVGSPAAAKNVLTVGATQNLRKGIFGDGYMYPLSPSGDPTQTASYSSRGPCLDGRIKPDIAAPGTGILSTRSHGVEYGYDTYIDSEGKPQVNTNEFYAYDTGTSMACPLTAGAVALVREWLTSEDGGGFADEEGTRPTAALMKAVITGGAKGVAVPNNDQGWGRVDITETLFPSNRAIKLIDRIPFAENEEFAWIVETTEAAPLDVQLCWVDYNGGTGNQAEPRLVNDLDLTVRPLDDPAGKVLYGNGGESEDRLNNMESVRIASAAPQRYLISVNCETILHDCTEGGAAALYIRGVFDPEAVSTDYGRVRIRETGEFYMSLDKAVAAANDGVTVEILEPVRLRATTVISNAVTIVATNDMASVTPVTPVGDARLVVATGADVFFTNVVFNNNWQLMVDTQTGSVVRVAGYAELGEVRLATNDVLHVSGYLTAATLIDAPFAKGDGKVFGILDDAAFGSTANYLLNKYDEECGGEANGTTLRWKQGAPVPDAAAAVRLEPFDAAYTNYRSLAVLLKYNKGGRAAVLKNTAYTNHLELAADMLLYGATPGITISPTAESDFVVTGGTLTFSNLTFAGRSASTAFVTVDGGAFTLEDGASLLRLDCDGEGYTTTGAIDVESGTVTMRPGSAIRDCWNASTCEGSGGGAIWLAGEGCTLNLEGGRITQCWAYTYGGAVYVRPSYGEGKAQVNLSGPLTVDDNWSGEDGDVADDLCLGLEESELTVTDNLTDGYVGLSYAWNAPEDGDAFAAVAPELQGAVTDYTLACFVREAIYDDTVLEATVSDDGKSLVWKEPDTSARTEPDEGWDVARIVRGAVTNYYYFIDGPSGAFADLKGGETIELLQPTDFSANIPVNCRVKLTLAYESSGFDVSRGANCGFVIDKGGDLTLDGVWVSGTKGSYGTKASEPLFFVRGGALTLTNGTEIAGVRGSVNRASGTVVVHENGTFTMMEGTAIRDCQNAYEDPINETGVGAALLVDNGTAYLYGGEISGNRAHRSAGVFIGNEGVAYVRGELIVKDNRTTAYEPSDFTVEDRGKLYLDGDLTRLSTVGMEDGIKREGSLTNVFGEVSKEALEACGGIAGATNYMTSAARFFRDDNPNIVGRVVTNETEALLVWSTAIEDGAYVDEDGTVYGAVSVARVAVPTAVPGLVYDGNAKTGVVATVEGCWLEGNVATNAGTYKAWAYPKPGYLWSDGTAAAKEISWSIGKATYDMSGVTFADATFTYDGQPKSIFISGDLPAGVMTNYIGNGMVNVGWWEVRVKFTGDEKNYERILDMVAHITIEKGEDPEPQWEVETHHPTKIAFKSIDRVSDTEWTLVITNREPYCNYRLIWTDDLTKGFTSTGDWEHAVGPAATPVWTTNVITTGGAWFWRAEGADGTNMVLKTEE